MNYVERMRAAAKYVQENDLSAWPFTGPAPETEIDRIAERLGCPITGSFREFIRLLGSQNDFGFCGVNIEYKDTGCGTLWGTEVFRQEFDLPNHYLVVWCEEGMQDACVMDCSDPQGDDEFPIYQIMPHIWKERCEKIADSFVEFFEAYFEIKHAK